MPYSEIWIGEVQPGDRLGGCVELLVKGLLQGHERGLFPRAAVGLVALCKCRCAWSSSSFFFPCIPLFVVLLTRTLLARLSASPPLARRLDQVVDPSIRGDAFDDFFECMTPRTLQGLLQWRDRLVQWHDRVEVRPIFSSVLRERD